jgi:hypothetical protein
VRRIFRILIANALGRGWITKNKKWLAVALGLLGLRLLDQGLKNKKETK